MALNRVINIGFVVLTGCFVDAKKILLLLLLFIFESSFGKWRGGLKCKEMHSFPSRFFFFVCLFLFVHVRLVQRSRVVN